MGFVVVKAVRDHSDATGSAFAVLVYLADRVFDERIEENHAALAWPSQATIARDTRWSDRTVARALKELVALGEIEDTEVRRGRPHQETVVWAILPDHFGDGSIEVAGRYPPADFDDDSEGDVEL